MISEYTRTRLLEINKDRFDESGKNLILEETETEEEGRTRYRLSTPSIAACK
jgi:hypothetical protein